MQPLNVVKEPTDKSKSSQITESFKNQQVIRANKEKELSYLKGISDISDNTGVRRRKKESNVNQGLSLTDSNSVSIDDTSQNITAYGLSQINIDVSRQSNFTPKVNDTSNTAGPPSQSSPNKSSVPESNLLQPPGESRPISQLFLEKPVNSQDSPLVAELSETQLQDSRIDSKDKNIVLSSKPQKKIKSTQASNMAGSFDARRNTQNYPKMPYKLSLNKGKEKQVMNMKSELNSRHLSPNNSKNLLSEVSSQQPVEKLKTESAENITFKMVGRGSSFGIGRNNEFLVNLKQSVSSLNQSKGKTLASTQPNTTPNSQPVTQPNSAHQTLTELKVIPQDSSPNVTERSTTRQSDQPSLQGQFVIKANKVEIVAQGAPSGKSGILRKSQSRDRQRDEQKRNSSNLPSGKDSNYLSNADLTMVKRVKKEASNVSILTNEIKPWQVKDRVNTQSSMAETERSKHGKSRTRRNQKISTSFKSKFEKPKIEANPVAVKGLRKLKTPTGQPFHPPSNPVFNSFTHQNLPKRSTQVSPIGSQQARTNLLSPVGQNPFSPVRAMPVKTTPVSPVGTNPTVTPRGPANPSSRSPSRSRSQPKQNTAISPELAAQVIKDFILPMFETDGKKLLKKKTPHSLLPSGSEIQGKSLMGNKVSGTVFHELKLSEMLQEQVFDLRAKVDEQQQEIQEQIYLREVTANQLRTTKLSIGAFVKKNYFLQHELQKSQKQVICLNRQIENMTQAIDTLHNLFKQTEMIRKKNNEQLALAVVENEAAHNQSIQTKQASALMKVENGVMRERLGRLYNALSYLGEIKMLQDKYETLIEQTKNEQADLRNEIAAVEKGALNSMEKVSEQQNIIMELLQKNKKLSEEKERHMKLFRSKVQMLEGEKDRANIAKKESVDELFRAQKTISILQLEIDNLNLKVAKLRARKNIDPNRKMCQNCNKEYNEKENMNWSCCTHRSEYGGTMWWCCGKTKKNAPGCKFQKHRAKEDDEDEEADEDEGVQKRKKCIACKEIGHQANECERDPNFRTLFDVQQEFNRISKKQEYKKLNIDAGVITFNMMEKFTLMQNERAMTQMLTQDDFNYIAFNDHIFDLNLMMESIGDYSNSDDEQSGDGDKSDKQSNDLKTEADDIFSDKEKKQDPTQRVSGSGQKNADDNVLKLFNNTQKSIFIKAQDSDPFDDLISARYKQQRQANSQERNLIQIGVEIERLQALEMAAKREQPRKSKKIRNRPSNRNSSGRRSTLFGRDSGTIEQSMWGGSVAAGDMHLDKYDRDFLGDDLDYSPGRKHSSKGTFDSRLNVSSFEASSRGGLKPLNMANLALLENNRIIEERSEMQGSLDGSPARLSIPKSGRNLDGLKEIAVEDLTLEHPESASKSIAKTPRGDEKLASEIKALKEEMKLRKDKASRMKERKEAKDKEYEEKLIKQNSFSQPSEKPKSFFAAVSAAVKAEKDAKLVEDLLADPNEDKKKALQRKTTLARLNSLGDSQRSIKSMKSQEQNKVAEPIKEESEKTSVLATSKHLDSSRTMNIEKDQSISSPTKSAINSIESASKTPRSPIKSLVKQDIEYSRENVSKKRKSMIVGNPKGLVFPSKS